MSERPAEQSADLNIGSIQSWRPERSAPQRSRRRCTSAELPAAKGVLACTAAGAPLAATAETCASGAHNPP